MTKRNRDDDEDTGSFFGGGESEIMPTESSITMRLRQFWPFFRPLLGKDTLRSTDEVEWKVANHHGPHNDAKIEWWYVNGHLGPAESSDFSFFAAFFRLVGDSIDPGEADRTYVHALNWAIVDKKAPTSTGKKGYYPFSVMDPIAPSVCLDMIRSNIYHGDPQLLASLTEILQDNQVPLPDTLMKSPAEVSKNKLVYGDSKFEIIQTPKPADAGPDDPTPSPMFKMTLSGVDASPGNNNNENSGDKKLEIELTLKPNKGPVLHGKDGIVSLGSTVDDMFYYFYPSCDIVDLKLNSIDSATFPFAERLKSSIAAAQGQPIQGRGWVDHEFGGAIAANVKEFELIFKETIQKRSGLEHGWEWAAILLSNGYKLSVTSLINPLERNNENHGVVERFAVVLHPDGNFERVPASNVAFSPTKYWQSKVTSSKFPVAWDVSITLGSSGQKLLFTITAGVEDQELISLAAKPSFWEGYADVKGKLVSADGSNSSSEFSGEAILECHGETDLNQVANSVQLLHTALFMPLPMSILKDANVKEITLELLDSLRTRVQPSIEGAALILKTMQPDAPEMTSEQKEMLVTLGAAFVATFHYGSTISSSDAFEGTVKAFIEDKWATIVAKIPVDYKRILLRTFVLREIQECSKNCPSLASNKADDTTIGAEIDGAKILASLTSVHTLPEDERHRIPSDDELKSAAKVKEVAVAKALFEGTWIKSWDEPAKSQPLATILSAQNVSYMYRKLTDSLTPTMETTVHKRFFKSQVTTKVSNILAQDSIDGTEYRWDSAGRGSMRSRSCLLFGGQLLYTQSILPEGCQKLKDEKTGEPLVEHKWLYMVADGSMLQKTTYGPHTADCFFVKPVLSAE